MATVKFNLRKKAATKPQTIYLIFRHKKTKLVYSTNFKVSAKYWNDDTCRIRNTTNVIDRDLINDFLGKLENEALRFANKIMGKQKHVEKEDLKLHLDQFTGRVKNNLGTLFGFIADFIEKAPEKINPNTGRVISPRTIQKYKTTESILLEFKTSYDRELDFDTIDLVFYEDFLTWMKKRDYSVNTLGKHIQTLITFLNDATAKGINTNHTYKDRRFKVLEEDVTHIYLNEDEIQQIYDFDFSENTRLERVRDLFVIACRTGLRFSDFSRFNDAVFSEDMVYLEQYKTKAPVQIPLHSNTKTIIEKYKGNLPTDISIQKMNDYIKEACELAGIKSKASKNITKGGARVLRTVEKWELITTHTGRRSFATNLFKSGFPSLSIMKITGHKTEKAFLKYINITSEEVAEMLQLHWEKQAVKLKAVK